jgi:hypothetical protein
MIHKKLWAAGLGVVAALSVSSNALARPEYVIPTGASNCDSCHLDNFGTGYKAGVLQAAASPLGKIAGLFAFLHPAPVLPGSDTKPVLHPLNNEWDVTVGEVGLFIPLRVSDSEDDNFTLQGVVPVGTTVVSLSTNAQTNLPMMGLSWKPSAAQADKTYTFTLSAKETGVGRILVSDTITTKVRVWPARTSATKNVSQFMVRQAQWDNNQLSLAGKVLFKGAVTAAKRAASLAALRMNVKTETGVVIGVPLVLTPDINGNWTKTLALTDTQVPCAVKLDYEGLNAARTVKLAPPASCIK